MAATPAPSDELTKCHIFYYRHPPSTRPPERNEIFSSWLNTTARGWPAGQVMWPVKALIMPPNLITWFGLIPAPGRPSGLPGCTVLPALPPFKQWPCSFVLYGYVPNLIIYFKIFERMNFFGGLSSWYIRSISMRKFKHSLDWCENSESRFIW